MNGWVSRLAGVFGIISELDQSLYVHAAFRDIKILNHHHLTLCAFHLGTPSRIVEKRNDIGPAFSIHILVRCAHNAIMQTADALHIKVTFTLPFVLRASRPPSQHAGVTRPSVDLP
jgi:hypothetical protein